jgi:hypothetical protein
MSIKPASTDALPSSSLLLAESLGDGLSVLLGYTRAIIRQVLAGLAH